MLDRMFMGAAADDKLFVEDVFSTYLYTGNGSTQTITNGIDLAGKGGLVWAKARSAAQGHILADTVRGLPSYLQSNTTSALTTWAQVLTSFNSNGFSLGTDNTINGSGNTVASWTFREAPKFFDIVTWTGNGANRTIAHTLGVAPGMMIVKRTDTAADWQVYHRSNANTQYQVLNSTAAVATGATRWNSTTPTSTEFTVGTDATVNASGGTYVAYLFAHDPTADGIIQCGTFTSDASNVVANVTLGWEPQWVMVKRTDSTGNWMLYDNMRGMPVGPSAYGIQLYPNTAGAEALGFLVAPNATGFSSPYYSAANATYIYMAIRRGPMRTPTLGTSVFMPTIFTGDGSSSRVISLGLTPDLMLSATRSVANTEPYAWDRLRGNGQSGLATSSAASESTSTTLFPLFYLMNGYLNRASSDTFNSTGTTYVRWAFRRAPGFFDEVCYTGINATRTVTHNLGVVPELIIVKNRTTGGTGWPVWSTPFSGTNDTMLLNTTAAKSGSGLFTTTPPTSTVFTAGNDSWINSSGNNYVAYLFASCPGVSKVGSYTGNGSSQTINCAFAAGARFVMIKRTDSTGDWYVWDSARGIVAGNDPHLSLNTTVPEVTTDDTIDTDSSGFVVNQVAATNVNVNAATYIYLAIA